MIRTLTAALTAGAAIALTIPTAALGDGYQWPTYHGPANKPAHLTEQCPYDGTGAENCWWDDGSGHAYWAIPVNANKLAIVYWNKAYNDTHGYVTTR